MRKTIRLVGLSLMAVVCIGLLACSSSDDTEEGGIDTTPITLLAGKDKIIQGADTISSSNEFVAYGKKNTLYGWHVGETTINVNGKKTISVTVMPKNNLYDDPICEWGCSMDYVKSHQKQGTLNSKSTDKILAYNDAGGATLLAYSFNNGKLESVGAMVSTNHTSTLGEHLVERYLLLPLYKGKDTYFAGIDGLDENHAKTMVLMDLYDINTWSVFYAPFKKNTTRSILDNEEEKLMDLLYPFLKD